MQIGVDFIALDRFTASEDEKTLTIPNAVIAREIVHKHHGEMIFKPADELFKSTISAANAWLTETHCEPIGLVTERSQIRGNLKEPRFKNNGIYTDLVFFKDYCSPTFLEDVKQGARNQLSIGYFYKRDPTSGFWKGKHYDSIQRNIFIDHVAVISERARCPPPYCGIGVDAIQDCLNRFLVETGRAVYTLDNPVLGQNWDDQDLLAVYIGGDPWEETEGEIRQRVQDPGKFARGSFRSKNVPGIRGVRMIVACPKGQWTGSRCGDGMQLQAYRFSKGAGWTMAKAKAWYKEHGRDMVKAFEEAGVACDIDLEEFVKSLVETLVEVERLAAQDDLSVEEIRQRIAELGRRRQEVYEILYPKVTEGRKTELQAELTVLEAELNAMEEVLAAKLKGDQEREAKRAAAKRRAARYHIAVKPGGNLSPPKGYPTSPTQYGDPTNFRYPLIPKSRAYAALRYFAKPKNRQQYSRREQLIVWERIVRGCLRLGVTHRYDSDNPLDRGLPASLKRRLPGYED